MLNTLKIFFFLVFLIPNILHAFQGQVEIARINDEPILSGEFLYAFNKNRNPEASVTTDSLLNYLDQYINFKLKVAAARSLGIDTTTAFLNEFNAYSNEIRKPYLQNPNLEEDLINEAYARLQFEINVAHILIRIPNASSPSDTLRTFNKIAALRERAINGEDFAELARKNSEDGSAAAGGELGYFTTFSMVYPFESGAYETEVGAISKIIRSQFGYHIIKVLDKREARGRLKVAHIFINTANKSPLQTRNIIQQAYDSLQNGGDWRAVCATFSEDSNTRLKEGSLPFYSIGQFPEPLLNEGFKLDSIGAYSPPVLSRFGWHILKLEAKEPIQSLDKIKDNIANSVKRSGRNQMDDSDLAKKLKSENDFKQDISMINDLISSILQSDSLTTLSSGSVLFQIGDKQIIDHDFINFLLAPNQSKIVSANTIWALYQEFEFDQLIAHEDNLIPIKYPEHQYLINEYREGLMLFEVMENKVWNKAIEDSIGLDNFYKRHRTDYPASERAEVYVIESDSLDLLIMASELGKNIQDISAFRTKLMENLTEEQYALLKFVKRHFEQNELPIFAGNHWKSGSIVADPILAKIYLIEKIIPEGFYELNEIKGRVISDYQDKLDEDWIQELRKKNKIKINKKDVSSLIATLD